MVQQVIDVYRLIDAICEAYDNPAFQSKDGITYCNMAVQSVAERIGYDKFKGLLANQMVAYMENSGEWGEIPLQEAQNKANVGHLVIAGVRDDPHGHVVVVRPGREEYSSKWACPVPKCLNVGKENFIAKGVNFAFKEKPRVWVLH